MERTSRTKLALAEGIHCRPHRGIVWRTEALKDPLQPRGIGQCPALVCVVGEDYLLEDDATELKTEVDSIVREEQKESPPNSASQETTPPSDADNNKPDDFDPFKAEQEAQSPRDQDAIEQVESGSSIPTNEGLANPEPINNPAEPDVFNENRTQEEKAGENLEEPR